ncbi:MAG: beta strand repeat-containing protein [Caldicoprobacterales bacterium]
MKKNTLLAVLTLLVLPIFVSIFLSAESNAAGAKTVLDISYGPIYFYWDRIEGYNSSGTLVTAKNSNGYIITGTSNYDMSQPVQINVASGTHNITLRDVTLYTSYRWQSSAVYIAAGATANITLEGENRLFGRGVGMLVPDGANITITGGATDSLTVSAVTGAGIGGRAGEATTYAFKDCGNVTISGGVINATGGDLAAGIGGGEYGYASKTIHIAGGTVTAATTYSGPGLSVGIGGGYMYTDVVYKIQITGGSINSTFGKRPVNASGQSVYKTTITLPVAAEAAVESLTIKQDGITIPYNITAMNTDANGKIYIYLPASASQTTATIKVGGITYHYKGNISENDSNVLKMDQAPLSISNVNSAYTFGETISPMASGGTLSGMVVYTYSGTDAVTGSTITNRTTAPVNAGSYTVTANLAGNAYYHDATASASFTINSKNITGFSVYDIPNQTYTGRAVMPAVTVKDTDKNITLSAGTDYTVDCLDVNTGAANAIITGKGNYTGTLTKSFKIVPKDITVSLTASPPETTKVGENVLLRAAIIGAVDLPSGTVTFKQGSTIIGSNVPIIETDGVYAASVTWENIPYSIYNLTAVYNEADNDNYNAIAGGSITGYSVTKYLQTDFSIADGSSYDIAEGAISKTYGDVPFSLEVSGRLSTGALTYSSSDTSVASISPSGTVTLHKSGTVTLTVQSAADERYYPAASSVTLKVSRATLSSFEIVDSADYTITEGTISKTYGDTPFTLAVNTSVGPINYASGDTSIATVSSDGTVTILKSGTVTLSAESLETDCYNSSTATVTLRAGKAAQNSFAIIAGPDYDIAEGLISKTYGDAAFTLETSGKLSAGDIIYTSDNTDIASISSSGVVTLHRSGTVTLSSLSPMDDRYSEALAAIVLNVGKADQDGFAVADGSDYDIAEGTISKTYGDAPFTLEVSDKLSSGAVLYLVVSGNDVVSVDASSGAVILFKSGTAVVRAVSPSDDRYNTADAEVTIQVARADQSGFAFLEDSITKTYGDASFTLPISGGESTGEVTYEVISGQDIVSVDSTSGRITLHRAGRATVTATKAADSKYNAAYAAIDILVEKAVPPPVIFPIADSITYGQKLSDSVLSMGSGDGTFDWELPDTIPNAGDGCYTVVFTPRDTDNFDYTNIALRQMVPVAVSKAAQVPLTVSGIPDNPTFGDVPFRLNVHGGSGTGMLSYAIISGNAVVVDAAGKVTIMHAGAATIQVTNSGDENYLPASYEFLLVVDKAAQATALTFELPESIAYGDASFQIFGSGGSGNGSFSYSVASGDAVSVSSTGMVTVLRPGEAVITAIKAGDVDFLSQTVELHIKVNKGVQKALSISGIPARVVTGQKPFKLIVSGGSGSGPSESPAPSEPPTSVPSPAPIATLPPTTTNTPSPQDDTSASVPLKPLSIHGDEETGKMVVVISIDDLPEGAASIRLPSGEILQIDTTLNLMELSISQKDIDEAGELVLIALNKENILMGSYLIDLADDAWQSGTSNGSTRFGSKHIWVLAGVLVFGGAMTTMFILLRKKR